MCGSAAVCVGVCGEKRVMWVWNIRDRAAGVVARAIHRRVLFNINISTSIINNKNHHLN